MIYIYMYIIFGKKPASGQLVAVIKGPKTPQSGKKRRTIDKTNQKSKEKFSSWANLIFWLPSLLKYDTYMIYDIYERERERER